MRLYNSNNAIPLLNWIMGLFWLWYGHTSSILHPESSESLNFTVSDRKLNFGEKKKHWWKKKLSLKKCTPVFFFRKVKKKQCVFFFQAISMYTFLQIFCFVINNYGFCKYFFQRGGHRWKCVQKAAHRSSVRQPKESSHYRNHWPGGCLLF